MKGSQRASGRLSGRGALVFQSPRHTMFLLISCHETHPNGWIFNAPSTLLPMAWTDGPPRYHWFLCGPDYAEMLFSLSRSVQLQYELFLLPPLVTVEQYSCMLPSNVQRILISSSSSNHVIAFRYLAMTKQLNMQSYPIRGSGKKWTITR